jgi:hypothetical protein
VGNASTDDTTAIQSAINYAVASGRRHVYIPPGFYVTSSPLLVESTCRIEGAGRAQSVVLANHNGNGLVLQPANAGAANSFVNSITVSHLSISRNTAGNGGAALWLRQCNGAIIDNVGANNHDYCIRITGGQLNNLSNIYTFASSPYTYASPSALWLFERADIGSGNFQPCYTININNVVASASREANNVFLIRSVDGLNITNVYAAFARFALMRLERLSAGDQITAVNVSNVYFDCVDNVRDNNIIGSPRAVQITNTLGSAEQGCRNVRFTNCVMANNDGTDEYLVFVQKHSELTFVNCVFANGSDYGVVINDNSTSGSAKGAYTFVGNTFKNLSELNATGGALYINNASLVNVCGNKFINTITSSNHIFLDGSLDVGSVLGNVADSSTTNVLTTGVGFSVSEGLIALNAADPLIRLSLPTSSSGLASGSMWNDSGTVKVKA